MIVKWSFKDQKHKIFRPVSDDDEYIRHDKQLLFSYSDNIYCIVVLEF